MGFWAGIKHALNSTLGTSEFKSLDKIIEGQRSLAASESIINILSSSDTASIVDKSFGFFKPKKNGSIRVLADITTPSGGTVSGRTFTLQVYNDSTVISATSIDVPLGSTTYVVSLDIPISPNLLYEVRGFVNGGSVVNVDAVKLGASIVDISLVEVI